MEKSSFFMSVNHDRKYKSNDFAEYFNSFIGNGVFPNPAINLQVIANNNMTITIKAGKAWINGYFYTNTDEYILKIDVADGVLNRLDRIALRMDTVGRAIKVVIKKGAFASAAVPQTLQRDADAYEIALADIAVNKGIISISQANITDLRLNKDLCGIVHGTVDQADTTAIFNQFQSWYSQTKDFYDKDIAKWTIDKKQAFDKWYIDNTTEFAKQFNTWYGDNTSKWSTDFNTWFSTIKGLLDGDIGAKLAVKVTDLDNKITTLSKKHDTDSAENVKQFTETTKQIDLLKTSVDNGKNSIYSAIVGKGITPPNKDFMNLVAGVNAIARGQGDAVEGQVLNGITFSNKDGTKRTGTATIASLGGLQHAIGSTMCTTAGFTVAGLTFQPRLVMLELIGLTYHYVLCVDFSHLQHNANLTNTQYDFWSRINTATATATETGMENGNSWSRTSTGFTLAVTDQNLTTVNWEAVS